jgi:hypothetical protein
MPIKTRNILNLFEKLAGAELLAGGVVNGLGRHIPTLLLTSAIDKSDLRLLNRSVSALF